MPSLAGNTNSNEASAMLLYEAPTGIAVFSFDEAYINNSVKDFWADIPQLTLEFFLKYEMVSTPIDLISGTIDDHLAKMLIRHCGSEKKLFVGSVQHKTIIEKTLRITCLYVGVPGCEVINCSLKNSMRTLLPEEKSEMDKDCPLIAKELITALRQHNFYFKPEMVNNTVAELARQLHDTKLCEMELLKFFSILLKDFIVITGIDTEKWMLFQFATVPKMMCCPESSYKVYHPDKIFSRDEYRKIEANAPRYKASFSKIGVLSVYEKVVSLHSEKCELLHDLKHYLMKAKGDINKIDEASTMLLYEAPFGIAIFSVGVPYLNKSVKDFWADIPQLSLKEFIKCDKVSTLFDPAIDNHLAKMLTRHCRSKKELFVGSVQHKTMIEETLRITCQYVGVPGCEVINCSLKNSMRTLFPKEKSETDKDCPPTGKELITFLRQHNFDVKPEMVNNSITELAHQLHDTILREMELLKFFSILLKDFIVITGIDTEKWMLFQFATVPKMMCCPESSYEVYKPVKIFSRDNYQKIEANASRYKASFSKIGVLSVYGEVVSLYSTKCVVLHRLKNLLKKSEDAVQEQTESVKDFEENKQAGDTGVRKLTASTPALQIQHNGHTGMSDNGKDEQAREEENSEQAEDAEGNKDTGTKEISDQSNGVFAREEAQVTSDLASEPTVDMQSVQGLQSEIKKNAGLTGVNEASGQMDATVLENPNREDNSTTSELLLMESAEVSSSGATEGQEMPQHEVTWSEDHKIEQNATANEPKILEPEPVEEMEDGEATEPQSISEQSIVSSSEESVPAEDMAGKEPASDIKEVQTEEPELTKEQARKACAQSTGSDETIPASVSIPNSEMNQHTDTGVNNMREVNDDDDGNHGRAANARVEMFPVSGEIRISQSLRELLYEEKWDANGVRPQSTGSDDKTFPASGEIRISQSLRELLYEEKWDANGVRPQSTGSDEMIPAPVSISNSEMDQHTDTGVNSMDEVNDDDDGNHGREANARVAVVQSIGANGVRPKLLNEKKQDANGDSPKGSDGKIFRTRFKMMKLICCYPVH